VYEREKEGGGEIRIEQQKREETFTDDKVKRRLSDHFFYFQVTRVLSPCLCWYLEVYKTVVSGGRAKE
jgi:hypothetical protein